MARIGTFKAADEITGGLSKPSKMAESTYNLPAAASRFPGDSQRT